MTTPTPGIRFSNLGGTATPRHLLDAWLLADATRTADYIHNPVPYRGLQESINKAFGRFARFTFIGELDPREDLGGEHKLSAILEDLGIDSCRPAAFSLQLGVSVHIVKRWPGYCLLIHGLSASSEDKAPMRVYVMREDTLTT